ncbi:hypothetical protein DsansV1_C17g0147921 [Dioscorea sansibarensis]
MEENIAAAAAAAAASHQRKRKLQYELSLPLPKYKFRNKSNGVIFNHELEKDPDDTKHPSTEAFHEENQPPTSSSNCSNNNNINLQLNIKEQKAHSDDENEGLMIYSNEFMVSQTGAARKPTVDQEFEQYFSMLMI